MITYELPYDINRFDVFTGTIVSARSAGIVILLDVTEDEQHRPLYAFAFCNGKVGQRVVVSIRSYNEHYGNFRAFVDSFFPFDDIPCPAA